MRIDIRASRLPRPPRSRAVLGLLLALLVQAGWLSLLQLDRRGPGKPKPPALLELQLLAETPAMAANPKASPRSRAVRDFVATTVPRSLLLPAADPQPTILDAMPQHTAVATAPAPLKLSLPVERPASGPRRSESMLSQVRSDPRSHSVRRTVESAVADAAGTLPVTVQASTDGTNSRLIRQGSKCIRVAESRIKTLNPMDESAKGAPDVYGNCVND